MLEVIIKSVLSRWKNNKYLLIFIDYLKNITNITLETGHRHHLIPFFMRGNSYIITQEDFRALYDEYKNRVYGYVLTITHSPHAAEEVTQELFIKIWVNREMLGNVRNREHYIFTMARNRTLNYIRKAGNDARILKELQQSMQQAENNVEEQMLLQDYGDMIKEALSRLSPRRNQVYRLSFYQGMKLEEIAERMNLSRNTVKNHLVAARKFIRSYLIERGVIFLLILFFFLK